MRYGYVITGKMRSGKDEFAKALMDFMPQVKRVALADELKRIVAKLEGISLEELETRKSEFRGKLIYAGKLGREINENVWVQKLSDNLCDGSDFVCTDVRFDNEFGFFKRMQSSHTRIITIRMLADESVRISRGADKEFFNDESETSLDCYENSDFDFTFYNNGNNPGNLRSFVQYMVRELVKKGV